jgi:hypothetical protein
LAADLHSVLGFQYATVKRWAVAIPKGLEPADWLSRPAGMKNHPHWIYGHIAVSSDVVPGVIEVEPLVPRDWLALFDQGTKPDLEGAGYPSPQELSAMIERTMERNLEVLENLDPAGLREPLLIKLHESIRDFLGTRERWLAFAPQHLSYHMGQIQLIQRTLHPETQGL